MDDTRNSFTFTWKIKNFSFSFNSSCGFISPVFLVHTIFESQWILVIYPNYKEYVTCRLERTGDLDPDNLDECDYDPVPRKLSLGYDLDLYKLELDYELSFLAADGSVICSETFLNKTYKEGDSGWSSPYRVNRHEVFMSKKHVFLPNDTLTIRCRMWTSQGAISESVRCSAETQMDTECISFVGSIKNFSSLKTSSRNRMSIKSSDKIFILPTFNLCIGDDRKLYIDIKFANYKPSSMYKFNVFIIDACKKKVKTSDVGIFNNHPFYFPLGFSKQRLTGNKDLYLPNDVLTLQCEVIFSAYKEQRIDCIYEYDCQDIQPPITNATITNPSSEEHHVERSTTLKDDMILLFNEGILSDTKLKTGTKTFSAHTAVLSARSPVFRSMFATDMKENINNCVDIDDLNADTVRQMLLFIYSDTLDELDYESAKSLYFAADKYHIVSLKHRCSNFLKENMLHSNCCDILLLADRHNDKDLKRCVEVCIAENDVAVFSSEEWKNLVETQPNLTTEILLAVYMRNRST